MSARRVHHPPLATSEIALFRSSSPLCSKLLPLSVVLMLQHSALSKRLTLHTFDHEDKSGARDNNLGETSVHADRFARIAAVIMSRKRSPSVLMHTNRSGWARSAPCFCCIDPDGCVCIQNTAFPVFKSNWVFMVTGHITNCLFSQKWDLKSG